MNNLSLSLSDLLGKPYTDAVCAAQAFLQGADRERLVAIAEERVDLAPAWYQRRLDELVDVIGQPVCAGLAESSETRSARGAGTASFSRATNVRAAPLAGLGFVRVGEDGKAYLVSKSEHYHASLGHGFPGYRLIENAQKLGIPNATHNNTRGHVTRLLEEALVRVANGIPQGDSAHLRRAIAASEPHILNRVINLETGSLAVESALKMMLTRFYRLEDGGGTVSGGASSGTLPYAGRTPAFMVIADHAGGKKANYHGTTVLTQMLRGMWPELSERMEKGQLFVTRPVRINDVAHFEKVLAECETPPLKAAGFFHEIVLMNYGGIRLEEEFLRRAYALCHAHDVPIIVDEIQSCAWSPEFFLFREYGLQPDFVSVGKGFPGGQYSASRILTTAALDSLSQFGALVTNGQEELASLAYLVTMAFIGANRDFIRDLGEYYEAELAALAREHPTVIAKIEGRRHLSSIFFHSVDATVQFVRQLNAAGIDISAHTYKAECPPAALTKIPLISTVKMVDFLIAKMRQALETL